MPRVLTFESLPVRGFRLAAFSFRPIKSNARPRSYDARGEITKKMALAQPVAREDAQLVALKVPPHSVEAEQSLLGGLLLDNDSFDRVADVVSADDFYRDDHRRIWRHIARLIEANRPADVVTVAEAIEASEDKDKTGGAQYIASLAQNTPTCAPHPPLRGAGPRARGAAAARPGGDRDRGERARAGRQGGRAAARRGRVEDLPDRRVRRPARPGAARTSSRCWPRCSRRSTTSTTATTPPTSPACRPATPRSTR